MNDPYLISQKIDLRGSGEKRVPQPIPAKYDLTHLHVRTDTHTLTHRGLYLCPYS